MQTSNERASERRKTTTPRIPVDLLVSLSPVEPKDADALIDSWADPAEAFAESYDADALDVSSRGLRLRSAVLPDVGQALSCRFELPETGELCEARGRVAWSNDAGRDGEFGVSFDELGPGVSEALERFTLERGPTTLDEVSEPAASAPSAGEEPARSSREGSLARVHLDGVASPIDAEITGRDELRLDVAQALPFLELGRGALVECDGGAERRRLEHVSLRIEGGMPTLILGLVAEISSSAGFVSAPGASADATLEDASRDELLEAALAPEGSPSAREERASAVDEASKGSSGPARARSQKSVEPALFSDTDVSFGEGNEAALAARARKLDEVRRVLLESRDEEELASREETGTELRERLDVLGARAREAWRSTRDRVGPSAARALAWLRASVVLLTTRTGPTLARARGAIAGALARARAWLGELLSERLPQLSARLGVAKEKRRTTAVPPSSEQNLTPSAAPRRARRAFAAVEEEVERARPRVALRWVLLALVALGAVGSLAYLIGASPSEPAPIVVPTSVAQAASPAPSPTAPSEGIAPPSEAASAEAPSESAPAIVEPLPPPPPTSALGEPTTEHGRLPMPGYPSIERASASAASSEPSGASAPSSADVTPSAPAAAPVTSGASFGSERVAGGQSTTLRMSVAPSVLEGQASADGFIVTIRGALSLDRAAPIARSNPAVDRASILNRGDHSVLEVRFVEGRSPAYRVAIRGQAVEVTIGR